MPSYGSLRNSPSLRKYESTMNRPKFSLGNIVGHPFAMSTISVSILGWIIAFVGSILSAIHGNFPNFVWWSIVYMFFAIAGVLATVATDSVYTYHVAVCCTIRWADDAPSLIRIP
jgi:SHO1 osmosensor